MSVENLDKIFQPKSIQKLDEILPPYWSKRNPIDMLGEATPALYRKVVAICLNAKEVNGLLIMSAPQALTDTAEIAAALVDLIRERPIPIITSWVGGTDMQKDRDFGPVILFGMGGVYAEVLQDRAIAFPPLNRLLANRLREETKVYRLLKGYRNTTPANLQLLEETLIRLSQLVTDFSEIAELDINPLIVGGDAVCAIDARVLLEPSQTPAPLHLVISPYPDQYKEHTQTSTGIDIFVRPIRPEDAPLLVELFESLSPQSVYRRFFTPMKRLPPSMLARFTQIDYDRHIALVALSVLNSQESMLGVARVILERNQKEGEFSIVVGDPWQGKGIGAALLHRCISIAKERGIDKVMGTVLKPN